MAVVAPLPTSLKPMKRPAFSKTRTNEAPVANLWPHQYANRLATRPQTSSVRGAVSSKLTMKALVEPQNSANPSRFRNLARFQPVLPSLRRSSVLVSSSCPSTSSIRESLQCPRSCLARSFSLSIALICYFSVLIMDSAIPIVKSQKPHTVAKLRKFPIG